MFEARRRGVTAWKLRRNAENAPLGLIPPPSQPLTRESAPSSPSVVGSVRHEWLVAFNAVAALVTLGLLGFQSIILGQQTRLLERQTRASQVDQAEKLRERIPRTEKVARRVHRAANVFLGSQLLASCAPSCEYSGRKTLEQLATFLKTRGLPRDESADSAVQQLLPAVGDLFTAADSVLGIERELPGTKTQELLDVASLECLMPIEEHDRLKAQLLELSRWATPRSSTRSQELDETLNAIKAVLRGSGSIPSTLEEMRTLAHPLGRGIEALAQRCDSLAERDRRLLAQIDAELIVERSTNGLKAPGSDSGSTAALPPRHPSEREPK